MNNELLIESINEWTKEEQTISIVLKVKGIDGDEDEDYIEVALFNDCTISIEECKADLKETIELHKKCDLEAKVPTSNYIDKDKVDVIGDWLKITTYRLDYSSVTEKGTAAIYKKLIPISNIALVEEI